MAADNLLKIKTHFLTSLTVTSSHMSHLLEYGSALRQVQDESLSNYYHQVKQLQHVPQQAAMLHGKGPAHLQIYRMLEESIGVINLINEQRKHLFKQLDLVKLCQALVTPVANVNASLPPQALTQINQHVTDSIGKLLSMKTAFQKKHAELILLHGTQKDKAADPQALNQILGSFLAELDQQIKFNRSLKDNLNNPDAPLDSKPRPKF